MGKAPGSKKRSTKRSGKKSGGRRSGSARTAASGGFFSRAIPRLVHFIFYWAMVAMVWGVILGIAVIAWYAHDLPDVDNIDIVDRRPSVVLTTFDGHPFATYGDLYGTEVSLKDLPPYLMQAVIATEDRRFYSHFGLDLRGLARAMYVNLKTGRLVQGGSTITQQLAKNIFLTPERTIKRKVQEVLLAFWLEQQFSKDEILTLYLNRVYLGAGSYGVEAASQRYFSKPARELNLQEAAMIAGLLKAPSRYAPTNNLELSRKRANVVLGNMVTAGFLTESQIDRAKRHPAGLKRSRLAGSQNRYFADWVVSRISDYVGRPDSDLTVVTTLDSRLQAAAEKAVADSLKQYGGKRRVSEAALLSMTPAGEVRAMVGGASYARSQYNRATQARRQPGSAFKPVIYLAALEAGMRPEDIFSDRPFSMGNWSPKNYSGKYQGDVTLQDALAQSLNTVAARLVQKLGYEAIRDAALRLGIPTDIPAHPSIALGTVEMSLFELTTAYASLANNGDGAIPHGIVEIRDADGRVLYRRTGGGGGQLVSEEVAGTMTEMLTGVISEGTGKAAGLDRTAAGKTGTSQDNRDALFVGYTTEYVTGVWFGNDDGSPMKNVTGGNLPAVTWKAFMTVAHKGVPKHPFARTTKGFKGLLDRLLGTFRGSDSESSDSSGGPAPRLDSAPTSMGDTKR